MDVRIERARDELMHLTRTGERMRVVVSEGFGTLEIMEATELEPVVVKQLDAFTEAMRHCNRIWGAMLQVLSATRETTAILSDKTTILRSEEPLK